ncbi:MAG: glycosyltransferase [candidate division WOR-3 bacterium]
MAGYKNRKGNFKKVLILHAKTGGGHFLASKSLEEYIKENFRNIKLLNIDGLKNAPFPYPFMPFFWDILSEIPFLWKNIFYPFNIKFLYNLTIFIQNLLLFPSLKRLINFFNPNIIFLTHPFFIPPLFKIKKKLKKKFYLITVLTDFGEIHTSWLSKGSDFLWIPSNFTFNEIKNKIKEIKYEILGYPVRKGFLEKKEFERNGILIMGGGKGKGPILEILKEIRKNFKDLKITVICGRNKKLYNKILNFKEKNNDKNIEVVGFTDKVAEYLKRSILIISKPGGSTVAEAVYTKTPFLAIKPCPGQETGNVKFLEKIKAGKKIKSIKDLYEIIEKIFKEEEKFEFEEDLINYENKKKEFLLKILS